MIGYNHSQTKHNNKFTTVKENLELLKGNKVKYYFYLKSDNGNSR